MSQPLEGIDLPMVTATLKLLDLRNQRKKENHQSWWQNGGKNKWTLLGCDS
jgi:hypothetical protein